MSVTEAIRQAVDRINQARLLNRTVSMQQASGSPSWYHCETVDDHLFEALKLIDEQ